jgi:threonine dehydrogenase-like Zn-dependent dehydrogenase
VKAIVYTAPLELQLLDVPEPEPQNGEVIVHVNAVGICGSEVEGFASQSPIRMPPLIMGHEFAGVRDDTGEHVVVNPVVSCGRCDLCLRGHANLCRKRAVVGIHRSGGFAERVAVPERNCYRLPPDVPFVRGALVEPVACAVHAFRLALEHDVLARRMGVIGAGTLGLASAIVGLKRGIPEVAVSDLSPERLETARRAGVEQVGLRLEGEFDIILDAVGSEPTRAMSVEQLRPGGAAVWIGLHHRAPGFDGRDLVRGEKRVLGTFAYRDDDFRAAIDLAAALDGNWVATYPLADGVRVFRSLVEQVPAATKSLLLPR